MFFLASKTIGVLITPHYLAVVLLGLALILYLLHRAPRLRRWLVIVTVLELWILGTGVVSNLLLYPLESRYRRPERLEPPAAIVVLTGMTDNSRKAPVTEFTEGADRFIEGVRLAYQYPRARLLISGGSSEISDTAYREAVFLGLRAQELGVPSSRLLIDREARNTRENAVYTDRMLRAAGVHGEVLLVTSAMHMPRAMGCFKKVGRAVVPWPVDYQRSGWWGTAWLPKPWSLGKSDQALHEYVGLLFYKLAGYI